MTYLEIQTLVRSLLGVDTGRYPTTPVDQCKLDILAAIRALEIENDAPFNRSVEEIVVAASTASYTIDDETGANALLFSRGIGFYYLNSDGEEYAPEQRTWEELRATYPLGSDEGEPIYWCAMGEEIHFFPTPEAEIDPMYADYWGFQVELSADGDTNPWTIRHPRLVANKACQIACEDYLQEPELAAMHEKRVENQLFDIVIDWAQIESTGRRPESEEY